MTADELNELIDAEREAQSAYTHTINVCVAAGCLSSRADQTLDAIKRHTKDKQLDKQIHVKGVGCMGLCAAGPLVEIRDASGKSQVMYQGVAGENAADVVASVGREPVKAMVCDTSVPFFARQVKIVLENCGLIDPERIEEYLLADGYKALQKCIAEMTPAKVVDEVLKSGLRGRGGAGFPTGLKWSTVAKAQKKQKYVICNADEGDPGAFMDRSVLESDPHRILEGMAIAAYATGASIGYIYCRAEYPLAVKRLKTAIKQAERLGLVGQAIMGSTFNFTVEVRLGAGAFVCGEETALIHSIEGRRGSPRPRPPFPAQSGLWDCPTLINNVETLANIAPIVRKGGEWFASIGTEKSKGTKVFALAGRVNNTGLIEVPMGTKLRDIIFALGNGIPDGRKFKAVQTGGPSGGCIPEQFLDMEVDYDSIAKVGSIMGSGGMIIMDETSCMVDVARFFMEFCKSESCGKCTPCRVGTSHMYDMLTKITDGTGSLEDIIMLEEMSDLLKSTSMCGLGMTAPNPVLTTLRYFRDEYTAHIDGKTCPAGICNIKNPSLEEVTA